MKNEEFLAIKKQLPELRKGLVDSPHGRVPKSIEFLQTAIANATSRDDKAALYTLILSECSRSRNHDLTIHYLRRQVHDLPDDPLALTSLASELSRKQTSHTEALRLAAKAVALAKKQDRQVKYSLTCQARIALEAGDYNVFHGTLTELIKEADNNRTEDHHLEFDFLDHVDRARVDQKLVARYRALAR